MRHALRNPALFGLLCLLVLIVLPQVTQGTYLRHLIIVAIIYGMVAASWDLSLGYAGVFNFAHLAFFGVGVYGAAVLSKTYAVSSWLAIPMGGIVAVLAALLVSLPVLRLKGIYVILVTFAFSQLCLQIVLSQSDITGGSGGMVLLPPLEIADYNFARDQKIAYYYVSLALLVVVVLFLKALVRSHFGVSIVALRDDEDYAVSRGISGARQRLLTMMASALVAGVAGGFYAIYLRVASPEVFGFPFMTLALSMLLLGGAGSIYGPIVAAFVLTLLSEWMQELGQWRFLIIASAILLTIHFYPGGIISALRVLHDKVLGQVSKELKGPQRCGEPAGKEGRDR